MGGTNMKIAPAPKLGDTLYYLDPQTGDVINGKISMIGMDDKGLFYCFAGGEHKNRQFRAEQCFEDPCQLREVLRIQWERATKSILEQIDKIDFNLKR